MTRSETHIPETGPRARQTSGKFLKNLGRSALLLPFLIAARTDSTAAQNFTINTHRTAVPENQLVILSANVHSWKTADGKPGFERFKATLREVEPDVVCIQEATADSSKISELAADYNIAFTTTKRDNLGVRFGNMVLSKLPIKIKSAHKLKHPITPEPRTALTVQIGERHHITNVHLSTALEESDQQLREIVNRDERSSTIYCGDFNNSDPTRASSSSYGRSASLSPLGGYTSTSKEPTFPSPAPFKRLDFVLSSCEASANEDGLVSKTVDIGSDHRGVVAVLDSDC